MHSDYCGQLLNSNFTYASVLPKEGTCCTATCCGASSNARDAVDAHVRRESARDMHEMLDACGMRVSLSRGCTTYRSESLHLWSSTATQPIRTMWCCCWWATSTARRSGLQWYPSRQTSLGRCLASRRSNSDSISFRLPKKVCDIDAWVDVIKVR